MRLIRDMRALFLLCSLLAAVAIVQAQQTSSGSSQSQAPSSSGSNAPQATGNNTASNGNGTSAGNATNSTNVTQSTTTQSNFPTAPVFTTGALAGTQAAPAPAGTAAGGNAVGPNDSYIAAAQRVYAAMGIATVALLAAGTWLIL